MSNAKLVEIADFQINFYIASYLVAPKYVYFFLEIN